MDFLRKSAICLRWVPLQESQLPESQLPMAGLPHCPYNLDAKSGIKRKVFSVTLGKIFFQRKINEIRNKTNKSDIV
jgi:hypothetical protein